MTANSYLTNLASIGIVRDSEKVNISRSINALQHRLNQYFGGQVRQQFVFGSYSRNTNLPRSMDSKSDIDYMVVFDDEEFQPQTYLDRIRRFAHTHYSTSEIAQSHPTIVLNLNHIRIELVPALEGVWGSFHIPAKSSQWRNWVSTDPVELNNLLTQKNQANRNLIKPLVRLVKYWNILNGREYDSFELEHDILDHSFGTLSGLFGTIDMSLNDYFHSYLLTIDYGWNDPLSKRRVIYNLKQRLDRLTRARLDGNDRLEELVLRELLPNSFGI